MHVPGLRSAYVETGGIVYFARMLDKIRLHLKGKLPPDYNLGVDEYLHFDSRCVRFLEVDFNALIRRVGKGGSDRQILAWCFRNGRKPGPEEIEIWNTFLRKRGWKDPSSPWLETAKKAAGLGRRKDIQTWFDLFDADERPGRKSVRAKR